MSKVLEIRWHGRGGQGAKTGSALLSEVLFEAGKYTQAFPEYGAERQGAPMKAYNRISDEKIRVRSGVLNPDIVVVIDPTLLDASNPTEGAKEDTVYVVNTPKKPEEIKQKLKLSEKSKVLTVDATKITLEEFGQNRPNAPILGALARLFEEIPIDMFLNHFKHKMAKLPEKVLEANLRAIKRGYEEVQIG
ncbi:pyruvate/ketoisovalerate oxidoreductase, gamma subunit [Thermovirga lienii DSM 17291]|jgi:pyruvate ferredoxin oxidoreductase gamma subunit|uniref:Pyruvate/ketoisovalerate oxidoreductase, gamma subunit n=1 Tax=Thermovirga lienii (strain ATCC BAA-1197 / DSM 17291 / Cas60314) TaxID=580340 RepID=G7V564_THELD|nr:2-oxoacid:acceptor oxidoreductase family protein [Thermovirga lienii]MDN5318133.1 pyruvate ferredoxin oxidoreductase gamma subunit [Thermovirga sp.]AER66847.1 pyruvate/ketoisovalerate oxidoreductase, gamma subunit [Thermovirga lienii DSM 17291]KUK42679.1 MAG: Pyruvate/ketoisovalerate oxidoreductase, gamma subunit [Thermovirga lienii]MDN5367344.1 pyruvate ferredoxin oxidoreductase gamma subunit [Thermovirga sp.]HCD71920.1 pyruvate synthase [Thermovirga lienii]